MAPIAGLEIEDICEHIRAGDFADIPDWRRAEMADMVEEMGERAGRVEDLEASITDFEQATEGYRKLLEKLRFKIEQQAQDMVRDIEYELN